MNAIMTPSIVEDPAQAIFRSMVLPRIEAEVGADKFEAWFKRLRFLKISGTTAVIGAPNAWFAKWIRDHYSSLLRTILGQCFSNVENVEIAVQASNPISVTMPPAPVPKIIEPAVQPSSYVLESSSFAGSRHAFDDFLIGPSSEMACAAAKAIAGLAPRHCNSLFIYGSVGVGKTHLIQATAKAAVEAGQNAIYMTVEKFLYGLAPAMRARPESEFRAAFADIDILALDDVQFLRGKAAQAEFCSSLNIMNEEGKRVILAADRALYDLDHLEDRIRSRLAGGLCVEIKPPDVTLRIRLLNAFVAEASRKFPRFVVPDGVIRYIATAVATNARDLQGAINRLLAVHDLRKDGALCVATAEAAIRDLVHTREPKRVRIEDIQRLVAAHYQISRDDMLSSRRTANVVRPRQIAMYLSKTMTLRSLPEIGRRFGNRDHTTILHAVRKIEKLRVYDQALRDDLDHHRSILEDRA